MLVFKALAGKKERLHARTVIRSAAYSAAAALPVLDLSRLAAPVRDAGTGLCRPTRSSSDGTHDP
jgi:hypothetical protein